MDGIRTDDAILVARREVRRERDLDVPQENAEVGSQRRVCEPSVSERQEESGPTY